MPNSLLDYVRQSQRGAGTGGILGRVPSSSEMLRASVLGRGQTNPSRVNPPTGAQPTVPQRPLPNQQQVPTPGGQQLPQQQIQQEAQQQLQARQARQQGVGRNREPRPGEEGLSFLARLFTGRKIEGLTKEEQESLKGPALVRTGLTMLGRPHGTPWYKSLAAGVFAARQEATQTAGQLLDEKRAQQRAVQYQSVFEDTDLSEIEKWREARKIAAKRGDMDSVKTFNSVLEELESGPNRENWKFNQQHGVWVDEENRQIADIEGNIIHELPEPPKDDQERLQLVNQIGDDYRQEVAPLIESDRLARSALGAPEQDPAAQQTLIMALNKLLDPGSVVRASEFARVAEMGGLTAQAQQYWNRFTREGQLPEQVEDSIRAEIERLHRANRQEVGQLNQFYQRRAVDAGVDPRLVIRSIQQGGIGRNGDGNSQNGNGGRVRTGAGTSGAPVLFPDLEEGGS